MTSVPWFDDALTSATLKTLEDIATRIPAYDLYFPNSPETPAFLADMLNRL